MRRKLGWLTAVGDGPDVFIGSSLEHVGSARRLPPVLPSLTLNTYKVDAPLQLVSGGSCGRGPPSASPSVTPGPAGRSPNHEIS